MLNLIIGFSLGCTALILAALFRGFWHLGVSKSFALLLVATVGFLIHPLIPNELRWLTSDLYTAIPALFWLLCQHAFTAKPKFSWYWIVLAVYSGLGPAIYRFFPSVIQNSEPIHLFLIGLPGYVEYLLIGRGLWLVMEHWSDDLVESRRRLRAVVVAFVGVTVLFNVVAMNWGIAGVVTQRLAVSFCILLLGVHILKIPQGLLYGVSIPDSEEPAEVKTREDTKNQDQLNQLEAVMKGGYFRNEKLTIAALSSELNIPEYLVRRLINEQLGYRNFNDYLNKWRIDEAKVQLKAEPDKPIMNISLDMGYRTLSSFNRAFKERTDQTPTQFRSNDHQ